MTMSTPSSAHYSECTCTAEFLELDPTGHEDGCPCAEDDDDDTELSITAEQYDTAEAVEFGAISDYYPDHEITDEKRAAWETSHTEWSCEIAQAIDAADEGQRTVCESHLRQAGRIEREWGDDPATRQVAKALGIAYES